MKNYIANERGDWATSSAFVKYSMTRSIHYGRMYTSGHNKGKEEDLCEALRCLGQGLHTLEDFGAHTNYCELALREMGFHNVFSHTGTATQINLHGHHVFPLVTGTFGMVDFFHSVLGEATDHFTQSEVNEMDVALGDAEATTSSSGPLNALTGLLGKIPGTKDLVAEAEHLKRASDAQEYANRNREIQTDYYDSGNSRGFDAPQSYGYDQGSSRGVSDFYDQSRAPGAGESTSQTTGGKPPSGLPGLPDFDAQKTIAQIYPILQFRDKVVRTVSAIIEKIPGLEALVDKISETVTLFVMSLLAPFIRPIIKAASKSLQAGSAGVIDSSGKHQYEPWTDPHCTDPTHSLLSKDHFSNILNTPAGEVASAILQYVVPRVLYAWQHIDVPVEQVMDDIMHVFHHPVLRDMNNEAHRTMFEAVQKWVNSRPDRGGTLNDVLSAEGVRAGKNQTGSNGHDHGAGHSHGASFFPGIAGSGSGHSHGSNPQNQQHQSSGGYSLPWDQLNKLPIPGISELGKIQGKFSSFLGGGTSREVDMSPSTEQYQPAHPAASHEYGGYQQPPSPQQYEPGPGPNYPPASGYETYHHSAGPQVPDPYAHPEQNPQQYDYNQGTSYEHGHSHGHQDPGYGYGGGQGGYGY